MRAGVKSAARGRLRAWLSAWALLALCSGPVLAAGPAQGDVDPNAPLTFGILPIGGPAESL